MNPTQVSGNDEIFLATTALEEFWDITHPILFLGEWCLLYSRRSFWEPLNGKILESPYKNDKTPQDAYHCVNRIYEHMLPLLGEVLNSIHGTHYSNRYWRVVIGPWLQTYLSVNYDKYIFLENVLEQYPGFATIGLSEESFVVPSDTLDFTCYLLEDSFHLQIYTKILAAMGKIFPCKRAPVLQNPLYAKLLSTSWKHRAIGYITNLYTTVGAKVFQSIILRNSYFSKAAEFQLVLSLSGKVLPIFGHSTKQQSLRTDGDIRKKFQTIWIGDGRFERIVSAMLFSDLPKCFVEGFKAVSRDAQNLYPKRVKAIFSANAWYFDEPFKHWAAAAAEKGALLLGTQHGGNYGGLANMSSENHETAIVDYYYTWGWERTDCTAKVIPMPATKLVGRREIGASNRKTGILWVATSLPRYLIQFPFLPSYFHEYLFWQCRFAKALLKEVLAEVRLRPHYENYGWDAVQRMSDCVPNIQIETWEVPFQESLGSCRLYVCDHLSTTFAEALAVNKPTVIFWSPQANKLRPEAQPYYDLLRKNGVLFDTPELAGVAVNTVYGDVETWWNYPERQAAVRRFCERFTRTFPNSIEVWADEFKRIAKMAVSMNHI